MCMCWQWAKAYVSIYVKKHQHQRHRHKIKINSTAVTRSLLPTIRCWILITVKSNRHHSVNKHSHTHTHNTLTKFNYFCSVTIASCLLFFPFQHTCKIPWQSRQFKEIHHKNWNEKLMIFWSDVCVPSGLKHFLVIKPPCARKIKVKQCVGI